MNPENTTITVNAEANIEVTQSEPGRVTIEAGEDKVFIPSEYAALVAAALDVLSETESDEEPAGMFEAMQTREEDADPSDPEEPFDDERDTCPECEGPVKQSLGGAVCVDCGWREDT